jgi:protein CpxP
MLLHRISLISAVVILAFGFPLFTHPSQAQNSPPQFEFQGRHQGVPGGRLLYELNLSQEQEQEIAAIQQKYNDAMVENHNALRSGYDELRDLMTGTESDKVIRDKYEEIMDLRRKLADLRFQSMLEVRQVLTEEQRQELAELMDERRQGWSRGGRGRGGYPSDDNWRGNPPPF